jgi:hypothetical protein
MQRGCTLPSPPLYHSLINADETERFNFSVFILSMEPIHVTDGFALAFI